MNCTTHTLAAALCAATIGTTTLAEANPLEIAVETNREEAVSSFRAECAAAGQKGAICVGWATSMEKIRPRDGALPKVATGISLRLARGEEESAQLFVTPRSGDLHNVRVAIDGNLTRMQNAECRMQNDGEDNRPTAKPSNCQTTSDAAFAASNIAVSVLGYVNVRNTTAKWHAGYVVPAKNESGYSRKTRPFEAGDAGWWPDPLLRFLDRADVKAGDMQGFWVWVHCPESQTAGRYCGTLVVSADDTSEVRIPFEVRVNDFAVGCVPPMPLMVSFCPGRDKTRGDKSPYKLWGRHKVEWGDFLADYYITLMHLYGANVTWDILERLKGQGRLGLFNLGPYGPPASTNETDMAAWREKHLPAMRKNYEEAKSRGLLDHAFIYGADEEWPKTFPPLRKAVLEMKEACPGVPIVTTARDWRYGVDSLLDCMDWFFAGIQDKNYNVANARKSRAKGHRVGWYGEEDAPYANFEIQSGAIDLRLLMGAQAQRVKPDGYLYYCTTWWTTNTCMEAGPFTKWDPRTWGGLNGNGSLLYPGPDGIPLSTIRLENFRDGLEDLWYAKLLEEKLQKLMQNAECTMQNDAGGSQPPATDSSATDCNRQPAAVNLAPQLTNNPTSQLSDRASWARRAKSALAVPRDVVDSRTNFTDDPAALYRWRDEMADLIEAQ